MKIGCVNDKIEQINEALIDHEICIAESEIEDKPTLFTNRLKAIIFMNLYNLLHLGQQATTKVALNDLRVNNFDLLLIKFFVCMIGSLALAIGTRQSFSVPNNMRLDLTLKSVFGFSG